MYSVSIRSTKRWVLLLVCCYAAIVTSSLRAQQSTAAHCSIRHHEVSPAEIAMINGDQAKALTLYEQQSNAAGPDADRYRAGWIRELLRANRTTDAETLASEWQKKAPGNAWAMVAQGEVELANGYIQQAASHIQSAHHADPCNSWALDDLALLLDTNEMYASEKQMQETAYKLDPDDPTIHLHWINSLRRAEQPAAMQELLSQSPYISDSLRKRQLAWADTRRMNSSEICKLVTPFTSQALPYRAIQSGPHADVAWALDVKINGSNRRLTIDTAVHGMILTKAAAIGLNLQPDATWTRARFPDGSPYFATLVKEIKFGELEFTNCVVTVVDRREFGDADGQFGADTFSNFLMTFDFPGHTLHLDALPPSEKEKPGKDLALYTDDAPDDEIYDHTLDPSMKDWTKVLQWKANLYLMVGVGDQPREPFLIRTGMKFDMVDIKDAPLKKYMQRGFSDSPLASGQDLLRSRPVQFHKTPPVDITFANIKQTIPDGLTGVDLHVFGTPTVGFRGILGDESLTMTTFSLNLRDNLVKFTYDPKRIPHCPANINMPGCF